MISLELVKETKRQLCEIKEYIERYPAIVSLGCRYDDEGMVVCDDGKRQEYFMFLMARELKQKFGSGEPKFNEHIDLKTSFPMFEMFRGWPALKLSKEKFEELGYAYEHAVKLKECLETDLLLIESSSLSSSSSSLLKQEEADRGEISGAAAVAVATVEKE